MLAALLKPWLFTGLRPLLGTRSILDAPADATGRSSRIRANGWDARLDLRDQG